MDLHTLLPILFAGMTGERLDANETAFFARELEHVYTKTYDVQYPENKARSLLPVDTSVSNADETYTYYQFDVFGKAKLVNNMASDFPLVGTNGKKFTSGVRSMGDAYMYTIQDLRAAAKVGRPLDAKLAMAARRMIENLIDDLACTGDSDNGITGLANAANIQAVTRTSGTGGDTWALKTGAEMLADVNKLTKAIFDTTKGIITPDTLVLPTAVYSEAATRRVDGFNTTVLLDYIKASTPWIKTIEFWPKLDLAGAGGSVNRTLAYLKSEEVASLVIPQDFEQFAPQARNLAFIVPCHARCGGVKVPYPKGIAYMDNL